MRTENEINKELAVAQAAYNSAVAAGKNGNAESDKVVALKTELRSALAAGASPCACGQPAIGVLKRVTEEGNLYEVGCPICDDKQSRGYSVEIAVTRWNNGEYVKSIAQKDREAREAK